MDSKKYLELSERTNGPDYDGVSDRLVGDNPHKQLDLLHASMGLVTEAGEFQDMLKKHLYYNKPLDRVNLKEEIGDILWYCALALRSLDSDFEEVMDTNIKKLQARFPDKFTEEKANNRDLDKERNILEEK